MRTATRIFCAIILRLGLLIFACVPSLLICLLNTVVSVATPASSGPPATRLGLIITMDGLLWIFIESLIYSTLAGFVLAIVRHLVAPNVGLRMAHEERRLLFFMDARHSRQDGRSDLAGLGFICCGTIVLPIQIAILFFSVLAVAYVSFPATTWIAVFVPILFGIMYLALRLMTMWLIVDVPRPDDVSSMEQRQPSSLGGV